MIFVKLKNTLCILLAGLVICGALPTSVLAKSSKIEYTHFSADFNDGEWSDIAYSNYEGAQLVANKDEENNLYAQISLPAGKGLRVDKTLSYSIKGDFTVEGDFKFTDEAFDSASKTRRNIFTILDSSGTAVSPVVVNQGVITGAGKKLCGYVPDRWYNIKVVFHLSGSPIEKYYEIYINGKKISRSIDGKYIYGVIGTKSIDSMLKLRIADCYSSPQYTNGVAFDNIKVTQMVDEDYEIPKTLPIKTKELPIDDEIREKYPVFQAAVNKVSGHVRGFGMLAEYGSGGPKNVYVRRITEKPNKEEPIPSECYVKVFDPQGNIAAYMDLTGDGETVIERIVKVNYGDAGVWRVSVNGGRDGDRLEVGLPQTDIWGVRGEMTLGLTETTPSPAYLYMAETTAPENREEWTRFVVPSGYMLLEKYSISGYGDAPEITVYDENNKIVGKPQQEDSRNMLMVDEVPNDVVWQLDINGYGGAIAFDGVPGVLCPTKEAAERLKGGTVEQDGFVVPGPMQARIRKEMIRIVEEENLDVNVTFPEEIIEGTDLYKAAMLYSKHSPLASLGYGIEDQVIDKNNYYFGRVIRENDEGKVARESCRYSTNGFANAFNIESEMNPYYKNEGLLNRTILSGLSYVGALQGDDIFRIDNYRSTPYPYNDFFFTYAPELCEPYIMLEEYLSEDVKDMWKQMMINAGDKACDFKCFQSNQWSHIIWGHLLTYIATGEERFLDRFETQIKAFLSNAYGPSEKYGMHEGGYFLEDYGPEGNYQSLNLYAIVNCYYNYKDLKEAKPELLAFIKERINDALTFNSYHWLVQPDGTYETATHMNGRTKSSFAIPNYPADYMARADFPLGLRRWMMNTETTVYGKGERGYIGGYVASNEEWARNIINAWLPHKDKMLDSTGFVFSFGGLFEAFDRPIEVEPAQIPTDFESGTWKIPGQVSWKRDKLYGLLFYDVEGSTRDIPMSILGGAPSVFWTKGTGNVIVSHANTKSKNLVENTDDLTFSCVFGYKDGENMFYSGKEHSVFEWIEENESFKVTTQLKNVDAELVWRYVMKENETEVYVSLKAKESVKDVQLNLPLSVAMKDTVIEAGKGKTTFKNGENVVEISYNGNAFKNITDTLKSGKSDVRCLRLAIPADGSEFKLVISAK